MTYVVRTLEPNDEAAVLALLTVCLAHGPTGARTADFLRWKHLENPFGASLGLVALAEDGSLAALRYLLRWELRAGGRAVRALRATDSATQPEHRGRGLFRRLTLEALDTVAADAELVFNTPNTQSRPGWLKMGGVVAGVVPIAFRPVRPIALARGLRAAGQLPVTGLAAPIASGLPVAGEVLRVRRSEVAALLHDAEAGRDPSRLATARTDEYLRWRYAPPGLDYRAVVVERGGRLTGLGIGRLRRRGQLAELTLGEVLVQPGDMQAAQAVLAGAARSGADLVTAHFSHASPLRSVGLRAGYLPVPGRGLTLTVTQRKQLPVNPARLSSWDLQLGDLELF